MIRSSKPSYTVVVDSHLQSTLHIIAYNNFYYGYNQVGGIVVGVERVCHQNINAATFYIGYLTFFLIVRRSIVCLFVGLKERMLEVTAIVSAIKKQRLLEIFCHAFFVCNFLFLLNYFLPNKCCTAIIMVESLFYE